MTNFINQIRTQSVPNNVVVSFFLIYVEIYYSRFKIFIFMCSFYFRGEGGVFCFVLMSCIITMEFRLLTMVSQHETQFRISRRNNDLVNRQWVYTLIIHTIYRSMWRPWHFSQIQNSTDCNFKTNFVAFAAIVFYFNWYERELYIGDSSWGHYERRSICKC